ncbi:DUF6607 family protein [Oligoflexus tunisiensis]|uniref:DUF6607 family protein n=1 Tax=Oligoflexus tunisiensis TaxID=708132 RepID=UPI00114CA2FB|nr:DUF6607 family protein [Oligoflexus tunisiensis]
MHLFKLGLLGSLLAGSTLAGAANAPSFIQNMSGCFSVRFNFVENGDHDAFYNPVLERAELSESDSVWHLRRYLILGGNEQVHWREEWRLVDQASNVWEQKVYGPFEDFRYQCSGALVDDSWRCEALGAPKPRRDRDQPYEKLDRENTLKVNPLRWIHMQRNHKRRADGSLYAVELGWNQYDRTDEASCQVTPQP